MWKRGVVALAVACGGAQQPLPAPIAAAPAPALMMTAGALGPITGKTPANLVALRAALPGYDVHPVNDNGLEFHIYKDGEKLFYVIPSDAGGVFNIHVVSPKVAMTGRPWKPGAKLVGAAALTMCDCWGGKPVCFHNGEHYAVVFDRACHGLDDARMRHVLEGMSVQRTIWSPKAFGVTDEGVGGHDYGNPGDDEP